MSHKSYKVSARYLQPFRYGTRNPDGVGVGVGALKPLPRHLAREKPDVVGVGALKPLAHQRGIYG